MMKVVLQGISERMVFSTSIWFDFYTHLGTVLYFPAYIKVNYEWIVYLHVKNKTIKYPENIKE